MRKISRTIGTIALAAAIFMNPISSFAAENEISLPFKDISASPALGQILLLQHMGYIKGYVDQSFKPEQTITRAEFVVMLVAGKGYEGEAAKLSGTKSEFRDVSGWGTRYINFAVNHGWIQGTGDGKFEPDKLITNAQAIAILMNSIGMQQSQSGEPGKPWYANYYLADQKFHLGFVSAASKPNAYATRSDVAELIVKLLADVPVNPSTGIFDTKHTANNTSFAIHLYEDTVGSFTPAASDGKGTGAVTLLNGQIVPLAENAPVYGDPVPGSGIWYVKNGSGLAAFVYVVTDHQDSLNRTGQWTKLWSVYQSLKYDYYTAVDDETLVNGAIDGMLRSLGDPYTVYMNPEAAASFNNGISSSFEGVGTTLKEQNGELVISGILPGSPAEKAGFRTGDIILQVNGTDVKGMSSDELASLIRGPKGTAVEFIVQRPGVDGKLTIPVTRDTIIQKTVAGKMLSGTMGKIDIVRMSEPTVDEFQQHYKELLAKGMKGLILDLRQNPGGLMSSALLIGNVLVPNQKPLFQLEYRDGSRVVYITQNDVERPIPIVVLTDKGTASAAEILAAALRESADAVLVGAATYGKGVVQTTQGYNDGSSVKYTESKWLTPEGNWIHSKGIVPDYEVRLPEAPSTLDTQLQKAEDVLKQLMLGYE
ncbi:S41 family peptidase [Paenibacillus spongiae]|uniref:S41 family peptidase n=1 Tax=Paenibacillus spongiae TaxID=2909671 RepID=A0ABY5SBG9_9BACL|nr:S41 family peptidase [Paenibacillus spongiae]UVI31099.1 S41 family peptidase [Paenibacillus spongiae]